VIKEAGRSDLGHFSWLRLPPDALCPLDGSFCCFHVLLCFCEEPGMILRCEERELVSLNQVNAVWSRLIAFEVKHVTTEVKTHEIWLVEDESVVLTFTLCHYARSCPPRAVETCCRGFIHGSWPTTDRKVLAIISV